MSVQPTGRQVVPPEGFVLLARPWIKWTVIVGGWTLLSVFLAPEIYLYFLYKGEAIPWTQTLALTVANSAIAAAFAPAIVWLTHRFPFERGTWARSLLVHAPACLAFSICHSFIYAALCYASPVFHVLFLRFRPSLVTYCTIVGFTEAASYFRKFQDRERQLARAQLELLRKQLHPHFLFNTLHTISAMMHEDVRGADRMISRLSDLLRLTLDHIGKQEVPLKQELEFLEKYLEIERVRFQEKLALRLDVEPEALDGLVPSMLLQPLAENSIRHGFGSRTDAGQIAIQARRRDGMLVLKVIDNGRGFASGSTQAPRGGLGLENTRKRLEQLYPARHRFGLENGRPGGAVVAIELPFHTSSAETAPATLEAVSYADPGTHRRRRALGPKANRCAARN
jgi:two-component sensor histidine kinase